MYASVLNRRGSSEAFVLRRSPGTGIEPSMNDETKQESVPIDLGLTRHSGTCVPERRGSPEGPPDTSTSSPEAVKEKILDIVREQYVAMQEAEEVVSAVVRSIERGNY